MDGPGAHAAASEAVRDLGAYIRERRTEARLSLRRLADLAQVSNPYLSQIERGLRKPSAEILQRVAAALRISAETLYVQAGILEEPVDDLEARILAEPTLTEAQRQALVGVYRSFVETTPRTAATSEPPRPTPDPAPAPASAPSETAVAPDAEAAPDSEAS